jgi:hypothetical protein
MKPKPDDTGPIGRSRLPGVDVEVDAECDNLNENGKQEFNHKIPDFLPALP